MSSWLNEVIPYPRRVAKKCTVSPNSGGTAGAYHNGKNRHCKITRVKKQGTVYLATIADIHDVSQNTPSEIQNKKSIYYDA